MSMNEPKTDKEWQAYYDAQTLVRAEEIKNDPERSRMVKDQLIEMEDEQKEMAKVMKSVAKSLK